MATEAAAAATAALAAAVVTPMEAIAMVVATVVVVTMGKFQLLTFLTLRRVHSPPGMPTWHSTSWHLSGASQFSCSFPTNMRLILRLTFSLVALVEATVVVVVVMAAAVVVLEAAVTACLTLVQVCRSRAGVSHSPT